jgi:hypothetical protein
MLWLDIAGRRRGHLARRALGAGIRGEMQSALLAGRPPLGAGQPRRSSGWNFVTRQALRDAGSAAQVLWRAAPPVPPGLDPLDFELSWRPLVPSPEFGEAAYVALERCPGMQRAWLTEEVLLKDGVEVSANAHLYFDSTDRRWPGSTADRLMALRRGEWSSFGFGRADGMVFTAENATEMFRRTANPSTRPR